ncbi:hypothetical protein OSTOST_13157 [Ostertagia ostertagi]
MATDNLPRNLPRQLVLLCDGTNNNLSGRHSDTHVVLMAELLRLFPDAQRLVYYDPGVGNPEQLPGTTVMDKVHRALDRIDGLAFGRGLYDNVAEGYRFLMVALGGRATRSTSSASRAVRSRRAPSPVL